MLLPARASFFLGFLAATALGGCAAISTPEGGTRDTIPPKLVKSVPANGERNVQGQSVRLEFSEQVQAKELQKSLIVAPVLGEKDTYKVREDRTSITLLFDQPFAPNTTYSFNFGTSISDITESNPAEKAIISFSTGAQLDSGSVWGVVTDLLTEQATENVSVMLYPETDTANIWRGKPYYLARTDKQGAFELQYLKAGKYRAYALLDKNQSNRYEEGERIAYLPELLTIGGPALDSLRFQLVRPDSRRALITTQKPGPSEYRISFNEGVERVVLAPLGAAPAAPIAAQLNEAVLLAERGRTAVLFRTPVLGEGRYLLAATDSAGNVGRDTISVRFQGTPPAKRSATYAVEGNPQEVYRQGQVRFVFNEPIRLDAKKPFGTLVEDSLKRRPLRLPQDGSLSSNRTTLTVALNTTARKSVVILLDSTAIQNVSGQALGLKPLRLRLTDQNAAGTLSGSIQTKATRYWIQLLDGTGQVQTTLDSPRGTYRFDNLQPGSYRIRVLIDANKDGRWQGPDPQLRVPTEPVFLFPKTIQVRSNFDNVEAISF